MISEILKGNVKQPAAATTSWVFQTSGKLSSYQHAKVTEGKRRGAAQKPLAFSSIIRNSSLMTPYKSQQPKTPDE